MIQVLLYIPMGALLALIFIGFPLMFEVEARQPADDRDAFIRRLPPPSQALAVREAHLRVLVRQEVIKHVKVEAVVAGVLLVLGLSLAASEQAQIWLGIAAAAYIAVPMMVFYALFNGFYVFTRYRSAHLRLHNDAQWHASGDQPAAVPNDA
jgi:hypothetical protein